MYLLRWTKIGAIGAILNGERKEFEVIDGAHNLVIKINWLSSSTINFSADQTKLFLVENFKYSGYLIPAPSVLLALHLVLKYAAYFEK